ncbi:Thioredoxin-like superfamily [Sesbania bispinosa]|nr:Thioredoxin-like superfamily [Sesbania bispinosa]
MKAVKSETQKEAQSSSLPLEPNMSTNDIVQQLTSYYAMVVFDTSDCCMFVVVKHLLFSLGVGPEVVELDKHADGLGIRDILCQFSGTIQPILVVFIGGKFLSGVEPLLAYHGKGRFLPQLKEVGALWL